VAYGKGLVEVTTNVRPWLDTHIPWALGHGSMMAAVGHLLSRDFSRIYIPSSHSYADLFPWGSHPLVDPLWSSERVEFAHDGCEATRIEKADLIARSDSALRTLRVCWRNRRGAYNCGMCEKCVRTMLNLAAAGALDRCTTFPEPLTPSRIEDVVLRDTNERSFAMENLQALEVRQRHPELAAALRRLLRRSSVGTRMRHYRRRLRKRYPSLWPKAWG
jgi:hypothetical protein